MRLCIFESKIKTTTQEKNTNLYGIRSILVFFSFFGMWRMSWIKEFGRGKKHVNSRTTSDGIIWSTFSVSRLNSCLFSYDRMFVCVYWLFGIDCEFSLPGFGFVYNGTFFLHAPSSDWMHAVNFTWIVLTIVFSLSLSGSFVVSELLLQRILLWKNSPFFMQMSIQLSTWMDWFNWQPIWIDICANMRNVCAAHIRFFSGSFFWFPPKCTRSGNYTIFNSLVSGACLI